MEIGDEQEDKLPEVNFVPCLKFVQRNVASARNIADGVKPNQDVATFQEMFGASTSGQHHDEDSESEEDSENESQNRGSANQEDSTPRAGGDEFNFDDYDDEVAQSALRISDIVEVTADEQFPDHDSDTDDEDDIIKPEDNLVIVGRVEVDCSSLEVYIFNEEENSLYVHHDFILPFAPLCIEWFSYDPGNKGGPGNLCAVAGMEPIIHIYDLDIHQPLEPMLTLGKKGSKKKKIKKVGHKEAILDMSWNKNFQHILASASVDNTVILWDLEKCLPDLTLRDFTDKVQTIAFNPEESQFLLTGSSDKAVRLFDCRQSDNETSNFKKWMIEGEVEKVKWNPNDKYYFMVGSSDGKISYFDSRTGEALWSVEAHEKEVTDFGMNTKAPGMLTSTSVDGLCKIWKFDGTTCTMIQSHHYKLGRIHCLHECPENPFIFGIGGDKRKKTFTVVNSLDFENVKKAFVEGEESTGETEATATADVDDDEIDDMDEE